MHRKGSTIRRRRSGSAGDRRLPSTVAVVTVPAESEPTESKPTDAADRTVDLPYLGVTYDLTSSSPMELLTRLGDVRR